MTVNYEEIYNNLDEYIGLLDCDGTLLRVNETALDFGAVDPETVIGEKMWDTAWFQEFSETRRRLKDDVERAAAGNSIRDEIKADGEDRTILVDLSIHPFAGESDNTRYLLAEGREIDRASRGDAVSRSTTHPDPSTRLISYPIGPDEPVAAAIIGAFLAANVDVFDDDCVLTDWIDPDFLENNFSESTCLELIAMMWDHTVVITEQKIEIYADSPGANRP